MSYRLQVFRPLQFDRRSLFPLRRLTVILRLFSFSLEFDIRFSLLVVYIPPKYVCIELYFPNAPYLWISCSLVLFETPFLIVDCTDSRVFACLRFTSTLWTQCERSADLRRFTHYFESLERRFLSYYILCSSQRPFRPSPSGLKQPTEAYTSSRGS